jgi:hypothetical protein
VKCAGDMAVAAIINYLTSGAADGFIQVDGGLV